MIVAALDGPPFFRGNATERLFQVESAGHRRVGGAGAELVERGGPGLLSQGRYGNAAPASGICPAAGQQELRGDAADPGCRGSAGVEMVRTCQRLPDCFVENLRCHFQHFGPEQTSLGLGNEDGNRPE